ncbi:MAG: hypothetical protein ACI841_002849, partial [Planctomycetota bacterium]
GRVPTATRMRFLRGAIDCSDSGCSLAGARAIFTCRHTQMVTKREVGAMVRGVSLLMRPLA